MQTHPSTSFGGRIASNPDCCTLRRIKNDIITRKQDEKVCLATLEYQQKQQGQVFCVIFGHQEIFWKQEAGYERAQYMEGQIIPH